MCVCVCVRSTLTNCVDSCMFVRVFFFINHDSFSELLFSNTKNDYQQKTNPTHPFKQEEKKESTSSKFQKWKFHKQKQSIQILICLWTKLCSSKKNKENSSFFFSLVLKKLLKKKRGKNLIKLLIKQKKNPQEIFYFIAFIT